MTKPIDDFRGQYRWLSNFHIANIVYEGLTYTSTEAAYQAAKSLDPNTRAVFTTLSPNEAKKQGRVISIRPDWEEVKLQVMEDVLRLKFSIAGLSDMLINTGDAELIEGNNWGDQYWGVCKGKGENHLGRLLMKIRTERMVNHIAELDDTIYDLKGRLKYGKDWA